MGRTRRGGTGREKKGERAGRRASYVQRRPVDVIDLAGRLRLRCRNTGYAGCFLPEHGREIGSSEHGVGCQESSTKSPQVGQV